MSKLGTFLKISALGAAVALTAQANAATFKVPVNYSLELVDGQDSGFNYSRMSRNLELGAGRHQIVLLFEGNFGNSDRAHLVQAANPIVVEIPNMPADANYTFDYKVPTDQDEAEKYAREQRITLINGNTKAPLNASEANYYILTSDSGFAILRNYRDDLASVGLLYAPAPVMAQMNTPQSREGVNEQGVQFVQARSGNPNSYNSGAAVGMSATVGAAAAANQADAQAAAAGQPQQVQSFSSPQAAATYNQLIQLYNSADDNTKLQFVKYVMSH